VVLDSFSLRLSAVLQILSELTVRGHRSLQDTDHLVALRSTEVTAIPTVIDLVARFT
jgi:hypothetical protein